jgi:hypothetical protein
MGHHHHYWVEKNRPDMWAGWKAAWRSLKAGVLDGYAAKDPREGWAELYRLSLGASFEVGSMGTAGDWQWCPTKAKVALATWRAYASCYGGEIFSLEEALDALKKLEPTQGSTKSVDEANCLVNIPKVPFGTLGFKGGVARNAFFKKHNLVYEEVPLDVDFLWWLPEEYFEEIDSLGGQLVFEPSKEVLNLLEAFKGQGFDVEVYPQRYELDYYWSRDLNLNQVWMDLEGEVYSLPGLLQEVLSRGIVIIDDDSWRAQRLEARGALMATRYGLSFPDPQEPKGFEAWVCLLKALSLGKEEKYARRMGYDSAKSMAQSLFPRDWDWRGDPVPNWFD